MTPIFEELKLLIKNNSDKFKKDLEVYQLYNDFISNIERTSDLPWVRLYWHKDNIMIKRAYDYKEKSYSLFQFYGDLKVTEMMNYVTRYLN